MGRRALGFSNYVHVHFFFSFWCFSNIVTWSWETRKVFGIPPAGRGYHASLLYDSRLFMFGGYDGQTVFDDIYILDLSTCAYLPQITDFQVNSVISLE